MKKTLFYTAIAAIAAGSIFTSCNSGAKKTETVQEATENLQDAQADLNSEYPTFKTEAEVKIAANEVRIAELREKLNKPGKAPFDEMRKNRIDELERKNLELKSRLNGYQKEHSDWETFKREFNHDMDGIAEAFEDLGKDNKN